MNFVKDFNSIVDCLAERFRKLADGKTIVNLSDEFNNATLDAIAKVRKKSNLFRNKCLFELKRSLLV